MLSGFTKHGHWNCSLKTAFVTSCFIEWKCTYLYFWKVMIWYNSIISHYKLFLCQYYKVTHSYLNTRYKPWIYWLGLYSFSVSYSLWTAPQYSYVSNDLYTWKMLCHFALLNLICATSAHCSFTTENHAHFWHCTLGFIFFKGKETLVKSFLKNSYGRGLSWEVRAAETPENVTKKDTFCSTDYYY